MEEVVDRTLLCSAIGANVLRLRKEKKLSQGALAEKIGISRGQINRIENGHDEPQSGVLYTLADILGVSADALRQIPS
jgi:transcriptional regulator with XRE-family HTH domain